MLDKKRASDIAQSLLNQSEQNNGIWDRWTHNSGATGVMNGDPSTVAIANFVAFGADQFDLKKAFDSLYKAAMEPTDLDLSDQGCPVFCRGQKPSLDQWLTLNYISDQSNSWEGASETLEQAGADFALSQLARRLPGREKIEQAKSLLLRSRYWKNLYNPNATQALGYIQGKNKDGSWKTNFSPSEHLFVEGSPAQYLWMIPFDGQGLNEILGGDKSMTTRLDSHFRKPNGDWVLYRDEGNYADVSNQPSILSPWMYLFAGRADKTQETINESLKSLWTNSTSGIPGQDDAGQMSSWYVFSSLGIYPLYHGRADLALTTPSFKKAQIGNLTIDVPNWNSKNIYLTSVNINKVKSLKSWINEEYVGKKVSLEFEVSAQPSREFGFKAQDRPPSY